MKKISFLVFFFISINIVQAQTLLEDQFQFNFLALNPALAGKTGRFNLNAMLGNQFNGTPRPQQIYQLFSTDGVIQDGKGGLALQAYNSNIVGLNNSGVKASYAYHYQIGELATLSLGIDAGFKYQPVLVSGSGLKQMYPFAGVGGLITAKKFFVGLSKPALWLNEEGLFFSKKPLYSIFGASFGDYDATMLNVTFVRESNKNMGNNHYLNAKAWFGRKYAVGLSYRNEKSSGITVSKIVPMAEIQFSNPLRMGLSYDPKPPVFRSSSQASTFRQRGIFQLFFRYEFGEDSSEENRMKYF